MCAKREMRVVCISTAAVRNSKETTNIAVLSVSYCVLLFLTFSPWRGGGTLLPRNSWVVHIVIFGWLWARAALVRDKISEGHTST